MIRYCFIESESTGLVQLGVGCSDEYYESIGMEKRNVDQSEVDGQWYLKNKCPHYTEEEKLSIAKNKKYEEALDSATAYIEYESAFKFDENNSIEATDGNIGKFTAYALAFQSGLVEQVEWTSKEDNVITLTADNILAILVGLGEIQAQVWNVQFVNYKNQIEEATTVEDVESIEINYGNIQ